jgi:hypothetical protein
MDVRVSTKQTSYRKNVFENVGVLYAYGETYHVPDEGPVHHRHRIHGETETLDLRTAPGNKRVSDILSHDGCIILEFIFPLWIGIAITD